jgi:LacI family transcriptional regulator
MRHRNGIREVAEAAGVSIATVSNVLNHPDIVAPSTRRRVEEAMRGLRFVRNASAHQLRAGRSRTAGVIILDVTNPFWTEVARGVEDRLAEDDCIHFLCSTDGEPANERRYLRVLEEHGVRGILVNPTGPEIDQILQVRDRGTPIILLDRHSPLPDLCSVAVDDVRGGELAAAHLIAGGHRRIGFLNGSTQFRQCLDRRQGVRSACRAAGLDPDRDLIEFTLPGGSADSGEDAVYYLLDQPEPPTAVFCVGDLVALGVLRGLRKRGLSVPEDVAVVGYDDVEFAAELATPLTSVRQPTYQLGQTAARLLLDEARPEHRHQQVVFQPELVVRESSAPRGGR